MPSTSSISLPTVTVADLTSLTPSCEATVLEAINSAFGPGSPGILLVTDLSQTFQTARQELLAAGRVLSALPSSELSLLEQPEVDYAIGWSRGRERFRGAVDVNKGSFYANPVFDEPSEKEPSLSTKYPHYMKPNIWPKQPAGLEGSFKNLGLYIHTLGCHVARYCDRYVASKLGETSFRSLEDLLRSSRAQKGRLLNYYPAEQSSSNLWCGYHNDHGLITGLIAGQFFKDQQPVAPPDDIAGLYVHCEGNSNSAKVTIPPNCIAFQIGESAQIASGGVLRATPHAVHMPQNCKVARVTLAVFLQPNPWEVLRVPEVDNEKIENALKTSELVPELKERYKQGDTFAEFAEKTIKAYCV